MKRTVVGMLGLMTARAACAQRYVDDETRRASHYAVTLVVLILFIMIWMMTSKRSPWHEWAEAHVGTAIALIIGIPVVICVVIAAF